MSETAVVGKDLPKFDAADKVTGRSVYIHDLELPGMLCGKILYSDRVSAKIVSIDASEALKLPGVFAVVTSHDFPDLKDKMAVMGEAGAVHLPHLAANCLASGKVFYRGHAVAAVAAASGRSWPFARKPCAPHSTRHSGRSC